MSYPRLSLITQLQVKDSLSGNSLFADLTDAAKTALINSTVMRIAALRNSLGKETYQFDTISGSGQVIVVSQSAVLPTKYLRFKITSAGVVTIASQYGFTSAFVIGDIVYDSGGPTIVVTSTGSEFTSTTAIERNNELIDWARSTPVGDSITFTLPDVLATIGDVEIIIKVF